MPDRQPNPSTAPSCPLCHSETRLKQVHKDRAHDLLVYKCRSCELEYPVVSARPG